MGVRILIENYHERAVLYCSTTGWAFGPVFESEAHAESFLKWLRECPQPHSYRTQHPGDPRGFTDHELEWAYGVWQAITKFCAHCRDPFQPAEATDADQLCESCYEYQTEARRVME